MAVWSVMKKNELEGSTRMDAEYYQPKYLFIDSKIRKSSFGYKSLEEIGAKVVSGPFGSSLKSESYLNEGVPFIRISDLCYFFIRKDNLVYISERDNKRLRSSQLQEGDLVLSKVGNTIGVVSIITNDIERANISENNIGIKLQRLDYGMKIFLLTFLNSKLGQEQILRRISGNAQPKLNITDIYGINFYNPTENVLQIVENLVANAKKCADDSIILYSQAEQILLKELGLKDLDLKDDLFYATTLREVEDNNRMDAEYYHPNIKRILNSKYMKDTLPLAYNFITLRGRTPLEYFPKEYSNKMYPVLKTKNIKIPIIDEESIKDYAVLQDNFFKVKEKDLLFTSMGVGSLGRLSYIMKDDRTYIVDGTIRILRRRKMVDESLIIPTMLFLCSRIGQILIYRGICGSTGIISLPDNYLSQIPIPKFNKTLADHLTNIVEEAILARKRAKMLLEQAKYEVEEMIEKEAGIK